MFETIKTDLKRYLPPDTRNSKARLLRVILFTFGFHATVIYRFGKWSDKTFTTPLIRKPIRFLYKMLSALSVILYGIYLDEHATIGPGLYIGHFGEIIISGTFGKNCNISQGVTVGLGGFENNYGTPVLGDNVWIGAGSKIFGAIKVGNGTAIGPNSVLSKSVPDKCLVMGNPARIIKHDYDNSRLLFGKSLQ